MAAPIWIREDIVLAIHLRQLAEHGGAEGIRDDGLLTSALARPRNQLAYSDETPDLSALAASYAFGIVRNHPFIDGNKRVGFVVCRTFLELNGLELIAPQLQKYEILVRLAEGKLSETALAAWIRANVRPAGR